MNFLYFLSIYLLDLPIVSSSLDGSSKIMLKSQSESKNEEILAKRLAKSRKLLLRNEEEKHNDHDNNVFTTFINENEAVAARISTNVDENAIQCEKYADIGSNLQSIRFDYVYSIEGSAYDDDDDTHDKIKEIIINELHDRYCNENYVLEIKTNDYKEPIGNCVGAGNAKCLMYHTKIMIVISDLASLFDINDYEVTYLLALKTTTNDNNYNNNNNQSSQSNQGDASASASYYNNKLGSSLSSDVVVNFVSCDRAGATYYNFADYYADNNDNDKASISISKTTYSNKIDDNSVSTDNNINRAICTVDGDGDGDGLDYQGISTATHNINFKYKVTNASTNYTIPTTSTDHIQHIESTILQYVSVQLCPNDNVLELQLNSTDLHTSCDNDQHYCNTYEGHLEVLTTSLVTSNDEAAIDNAAMDTLHKHSDLGDFYNVVHNGHQYQVEIIQISGNKTKERIGTRTPYYNTLEVENSMQSTSSVQKSSSKNTKQIILIVASMLIVVLILLLFIVQIKKRRRLQEVVLEDGELVHNDDNDNMLDHDGNYRNYSTKNVPASIFLDEYNQQRSLPPTHQHHNHALSAGYSEDSSIIKPRYSDLGGVYKSQDVHRCVSASCNVCKHNNNQRQKDVEFFPIS